MPKSGGRRSAGALQNRLRPDGTLVADPARGLFMGNRGRIHDPATKTLLRRRWSTKAWIICETEFRGRHRAVMGPASYTEIFMLDEVTGLAAGHRPCFECRRREALAFAGSLARARGLDAMKAVDIDGLLHGERRLSARRQAISLAADDIETLPDGTIVEAGGHFYALRGASAIEWAGGGYGVPRARRELSEQLPRLVTPPATVGALDAGYRPRWHPSAAHGAR